jgi:hypothetical protein
VVPFGTLMAGCRVRLKGYAKGDASRCVSNGASASGAGSAVVGVSSRSKRRWSVQPSVSTPAR